MYYNFIVIGAGSGGLSVASAASKMGASVLLVEKHIMGGDCLNTGCVPSKALLKFSHGAYEIKKLSKLGFNIPKVDFDFKNLMEYVHKSIKEIEPKDSKERYSKLGVDVVFGEASFVNKNTISINGTAYSGKNIVIATGSTPFIPPIPGIENIDILTSENIFTIKTFPKRLLVIGAGTIGLELGQGFSNLGSKVYVVNKNSSIFPRDDKEVSEFMKGKFKNSDLEILYNSKVTKLYKDKNGEITANIECDKKKFSLNIDAVFVATGRTPNTEGLNLGSIGIKTKKNGYINTDLRMRTNIKNIYACGDVTGNFAFTHMANYEAGIIIRNAIFRLPAKADYSKKVWTTFTIPSIAHSGLTEEEAKKLNKFSQSLLINFDNSDRFLIESETDGFLKIILDSKNRVIGATLLSENSEELIHTLSLLISKKLKLSTFLDIIIPYPMRGEILKEASYKKSEELLTPLSKKLIKFLVK